MCPMVVNSGHNQALVYTCKKIRGATKILGEYWVAITDEVIGVFQLLGHVPGLHPKVYAYAVKRKHISSGTQKLLIFITLKTQARPYTRPPW